MLKYIYKDQVFVLDIMKPVFNLDFIRIRNWIITIGEWMLCILHQLAISNDQVINYKKITGIFPFLSREKEYFRLSVLVPFLTSNE